MSYDAPHRYRIDLQSIMTTLGRSPMSSVEVVKVQVSRMKANAPAVISPKENAARITQQKLDAAVLRAMNGQAKGYFKASFIDGRWKLGRKVADESW